MVEAISSWGSMGLTIPSSGPSRVQLGPVKSVLQTVFIHDSLYEVEPVHQPVQPIFFVYIFIYIKMLFV